MKFREYGTDVEKDRLVTSEDINERISAVKEGYGLDVLINDENKEVREAIVSHKRPHDLEILIDDEAWEVRLAVAQCTAKAKDLALLSFDENADVRAAANLKMQQRRKIAERA